MVVLAVELLQLGLEVRAHLAHDLLAPRQHGVSHGLAPVLRDKNQMNVKVVDDVTARAYIGIGVPSG
ncbi:hypothetical protein GCM10023329_54270 [Streptomyces sanyensis]|uniref:Uncharacterized protein n=1 Tax=Streptomyces sanyensis TaxID=568869 RepID=A0ABP9BIX4_9ACTN